jgi:hypothetical protein
VAKVMAHQTLEAALIGEVTDGEPGRIDVRGAGSE